MTFDLDQFIMEYEYSEQETEEYNDIEINNLTQGVEDD